MNKKCNSPTDYLVISLLDSTVYGICCSVCFMHPSILDAKIPSIKLKALFIFKNTLSITIIYSLSVFISELYKQNKYKLENKENVNMANRTYNRLLVSFFATLIPMAIVRSFYFIDNKYNFFSKNQFKIATLCLFGFNAITYKN